MFNHCDLCYNPYPYVCPGCNPFSPPDVPALLMEVPPPKDETVLASLERCSSIGLFVPKRWVGSGEDVMFHNTPETFQR